MITTANYIVKAVVDGEVFIFQYDEAPEVWDALEQFWHGDYPEVLIDKGGGLFPIDVIAMDGGKAIRKYYFAFNAGVFHAFFDHGHTADGIYTLDQFAKDIERTNEYLADRLKLVKAANDDAELKAVIDSIYSEGFEDGANADNEKQNPEQLTAMMDRWAGFCYNHPPYKDVILWMVGSKQHYLYQHFCAKFSHLCDVCHDDTMGAWMKFYRELDSEWAERLMQYVYCEWKKNK